MRVLSTFSVKPQCINRMKGFLHVSSWRLILLKMPGLVNTLFLILENIKYICNDLTNFSGVCVCVY